LSSSSGIQAAIIPPQREHPATAAAGFILAPYFTPPFCSLLVSSPSVPFERRRFSCGQMPTSYDPSYGLSLPLLLVAIPSEHSPISPFAPAPFSAVKPRILFFSVGLDDGMFPNRLTTQ
jgi:hypothetical protein